MSAGFPVSPGTTAFTVFSRSDGGFAFSLDNQLQFLRQGYYRTPTPCGPAGHFIRSYRPRTCVRAVMITPPPTCASSRLPVRCRARHLYRDEVIGVNDDGSHSDHGASSIACIPTSAPCGVDACKNVHCHRYTRALYAPHQPFSGRLWRSPKFDINDFSFILRLVIGFYTFFHGKTSSKIFVRHIITCSALMALDQDL